MLDDILNADKWLRIPANRHKCIVQRIHMDYPVIAMSLQSTKKTNVVLQSAPRKLYSDHCERTNTDLFNKFIYPGSSFSRTVRIDD